MGRASLVLVTLLVMWGTLSLDPALGAGRAVSVTAGDAHTCALGTAGGVQCWGDNLYGQLGDGTRITRTTPVQVAGLPNAVASVVAGGNHTCDLMGGVVKCWGHNGYGELGDGTSTYRDTPTDVVGMVGEVAALGAGLGHTCAVMTNGAVRCWGLNNFSQLGDGTITSWKTPTEVVGLAGPVAALALGDYYTCALGTAGWVQCWGRNEYGQLGDGTTTNRVTPTDVAGLSNGVVALAAAGTHTCAVTTGGGVKCWGYPVDGAYGLSLTPKDITGLSSGVATIAAGEYHTCALMATGGLKCWGHNTFGQVGAGSMDVYVTPTDVVGLTSGVIAVAAGRRHTCAVTSGGGVRCWGANWAGQLGDGTTNQSDTPVRPPAFRQMDFDGDDVVDLAVYRPSTGTWFSLDSSTGNSTSRQQGWGVQAQGDTPAAGDYDGDGVVDPTVYRPQHGTWFVLKSSSSFTQYAALGWGSATDTLVPGDYDGDGRTDIAVYRPSTGQWFVLPSSTDFGTGWAPVTFGVPAQSDVPVAGDFDGDGKRDPAVYRPSTGTWFWLKSSASYAQYEWKGWGVQAQGDTPAPGDYDGDGKTDPCVFRPGTGTWFVLESHANYATWSWVGWGQTGDTLAAADYDGDGKTDAAIYRPTTGEWWVRPSGGASPWSLVFGQAGDTPLVVR